MDKRFCLKTIPKDGLLIPMHTGPKGVFKKEFTHHSIQIQRTLPDVILAMISDTHVYPGFWVEGFSILGFKKVKKKFMIISLEQELIDLYQRRCEWKGLGLN